MITENENQGGSLRETLEAEMDKMTAAEPVEAPVAAPAEVDAAEPVSADDAPTLVETPEQKAARVRDEAGRFAKEAKKPAPVAQKAPKVPALEGAPATAVTPRPAAQPGAEPLKAPQSWKPAAREKWAALPPEIQQEIHRRERDMKLGIDEGAEDRKLGQGLKQVVAPYEAMIRAEGGDVHRAVGSLLQTAYALRTAPPMQKAQLIKSIIDTYGVNVEHLAQLYEGAAPQPAAPQSADPSAIAAQVRQQVMQEFQQTRQQQLLEKARSETQAFAEKNEFYEDVRHIMASLAEASAAKGLKPSLQELYDSAIRASPEHWEIVRQREAASQANAAQASTQRARAASSSVRSHPANAPASGGPKTLRDQLAANWELAGR